MLISNIPLMFQDPSSQLSYTPTVCLWARNNEHPPISHSQNKNSIISLQFYHPPLIVITLFMLSLNLRSPSIKRCLPWVAAQPFIGPHKSNIELYCLAILSKCSLFESWCVERVWVAMGKKYKRLNRVWIVKSLA